MDSPSPEAIAPVAPRAARRGAVGAAVAPGRARWARPTAAVSLVALLVVCAIHGPWVRPMVGRVAEGAALVIGMTAALGSVWVGAAVHGRRTIMTLFLLGYLVLGVTAAGGSAPLRLVGLGLFTAALVWNVVALRRPVG